MNLNLRKTENTLTNVPSVDELPKGWEKEDDEWYTSDKGGVHLSPSGGWYGHPKCKSKCNPKLGPFTTAMDAILEVEAY